MVMRCKILVGAHVARASNRRHAEDKSLWARILTLEHPGHDDDLSILYTVFAVTSKLQKRSSRCACN